MRARTHARTRTHYFDHYPLTATSAPANGNSLWAVRLVVKDGRERTLVVMFTSQHANHGAQSLPNCACAMTCLCCRNLRNRSARCIDRSSSIHVHRSGLWQEGQEETKTQAGIWSSKRCITDGQMNRIAHWMPHYVCEWGAGYDRSRRTLPMCSLADKEHSFPRATLFGLHNTVLFLLLHCLVYSVTNLFPVLLRK